MLREGGKISSKRVITFVAALMLFICTMTELFTSLEVSKETFQNLMYLVSGGMLTVVAEKFGKWKSNDKETK